jgi:hypothetical protein
MAPTTETPALHVTIAANLEKLRADLGDARSMIDATLQSFTRARDAAPAVTTLANATKELGSQAQRSTTFTQDLHSALQKFDGTLSAVGLNINAGTRALAEIGQASTQTVGALGAVGAAGLVVGAAMAGWDFGRAIAGWLGTDAAIDRLIGTSQRLKDEVAGAQLDTIAHANALGAATTNYATAVEFLNQKHKEAADAQKAYEVGLKAVTEAGQGFEQTLHTIDGTRRRGDQVLPGGRRVAEGPRRGVRADGRADPRRRRRARARYRNDQAVGSDPQNDVRARAAARKGMGRRNQTHDGRAQ